MILRQKKNRLLVLAFATAGLAASTGNLKALATTDDTQAIQNLILAHQGSSCTINAQNLGHPSPYNVSATIFIPSKTTVQGDDQGATVVQAIQPFVGTIFSFGSSTKNSPSTGSTLRNLTVNGNAKAYSGTCGAGGGPGIYCPSGSSMIQIYNVEVKNDGLNGLGLHGMGTSSTAYAASVHDCFIHNNFANGINISGVTPSTCSPNNVTTPTAWNLVNTNTVQNNDQADAGVLPKRFHGINVGELACFTTVASNTVQNDDISLYDSGQYDAALSQVALPKGSPLVPQGNKVLSNWIQGAVVPSTGVKYDGIHVNGNEFQTAIDGNQD
jgi:hypothetical protein